MTDIEIIRDARARLDTDEGKRDWGLSVYMIRDLQATRDAGLDGLAWEMAEIPGSYREAVWLLDLLIKRVEGEMLDAPDGN